MAELKKAFLISVVVSLCICAGLGIWIILLGSSGSLEQKIFLSTVTFGAFSLTGLCSSILKERNDRAWVADAGIISSVLSVLVVLVLIWGPSFTSEWKLLGTSALTSFTLAHASILLLIRTDVKLVRRSLQATLFFMGSVYLMLMVLFWEIIRYPPDIYMRVLGSFAILDVLGTLVTPILNKVCSSHTPNKNPKK